MQDDGRTRHPPLGRCPPNSCQNPLVIRGRRPPNRRVLSFDVSGVYIVGSSRSGGGAAVPRPFFRFPPCFPRYPSPPPPYTAVGFKLIFRSRPHGSVHAGAFQYRGRVCRHVTARFPYRYSRAPPRDKLFGISSRVHAPRRPRRRLGRRRRCNVIMFCNRLRYAMSI